MMKNIFFITTLLFVFCGLAIAQSEKNEATVFDNALKTCLANTSSADKQEKCLEKALEDCIDSESSGNWEAGCATRAEQLWDRELNKVYKELQGKLTSKERKVLKSAQRSWIKYRDAEYNLIDAMYSFEKGSMNIPFNAHARMKVVMKRTLALKHYSEGYLPSNF